MAGLAGLQVPLLSLSYRPCLNGVDSHLKPQLPTYHENLVLQAFLSLLRLQPNI